MRDGDVIRLDSEAGTLRVELSDAELLSRAGSGAPASDDDWVGTGRELFNVFRHAVGGADAGAAVFGLPAASPRTGNRRFPCPLLLEVKSMTASSHHIGDLLNRAPVIPVIVIDDEAVAVPLARALVAGGLTVLEVTLRTKCALASIKRIVAEVPDAVVGAGTILTQADVAASVEAGAQFLVSPGSTPAVLDAMLDSGAAPTGGGDRVGGHGPHRAWIEARQVLPAQPAGGVAYLKALAGPMPDFRFCPTGGIDLTGAPDFLALPNVACVGGSWITPRDAVAAGDWGRIETLAREAAQLRQPERA